MSLETIENIYEINLIVREIHNFSACQYKTQSPAIMAKFHDLDKKNFDAGIPDF